MIPGGQCTSVLADTLEKQALCTVFEPPAATRMGRYAGGIIAQTWPRSVTVSVTAKAENRSKTLAYHTDSVNTMAAESLQGPFNHDFHRTFSSETDCSTPAAHRVPHPCTRCAPAPNN